MCHATWSQINPYSNIQTSGGDSQLSLSQSSTRRSHQRWRDREKAAERRKSQMPSSWRLRVHQISFIVGPSLIHVWKWSPWPKLAYIKRGDTTRTASVQPRATTGSSWVEGRQLGPTCRRERQTDGADGARRLTPAAVWPDNAFVPLACCQRLQMGWHLPAKTR